VIRAMKESACYVAFNPQKEEITEHEKGSSHMYKLPDGSVIALGAERFRAAEVLFRPELIGLEYPGIHKLLVDAIDRTDIEVRKTLYSQAVLSGGSTMFQGMGERLLNEVRKTAPKDIKIRISAPPERHLSTWKGGSILATLATFKKMWVSKEEYDEEGFSVVHRKTF